MGKAPSRQSAHGQGHGEREHPDSQQQRGRAADAPCTGANTGTATIAFTTHDRWTPHAGNGLTLFTRL